MTEFSGCNLRWPQFSEDNTWLPVYLQFPSKMAGKFNHPKLSQEDSLKYLNEDGFDLGQAKLNLCFNPEDAEKEIFPEEQARSFLKPQNDAGLVENNVPESPAPQQEIQLCSDVDNLRNEESPYGEQCKVYLKQPSEEQTAAVMSPNSSDSEAGNEHLGSDLNPDFSQVPINEASAEHAVGLAVSASEATVIMELVNESNCTASEVEFSQSTQQVVTDIAVKLRAARRLLSLDPYDLTSTDLDECNLEEVELSENALKDDFECAGIEESSDESADAMIASSLSLTQSGGIPVDETPPKANSEAKCFIPSEENINSQHVQLDDFYPSLNTEDDDVAKTDTVIRQIIAEAEPVAAFECSRVMSSNENAHRHNSREFTPKPRNPAIHLPILQSVISDANLEKDVYSYDEEEGEHQKDGDVSKEIEIGRDGHVLARSVDHVVTRRTFESLKAFSVPPPEKISLRDSVSRGLNVPEDVLGEGQAEPLKKIKANCAQKIGCQLPRKKSRMAPEASRMQDDFQETTLNDPRGKRKLPISSAIAKDPSRKPTGKIDGQPNSPYNFRRRNANGKNPLVTTSTVGSKKVRENGMQGGKAVTGRGSSAEKSSRNLFSGKSFLLTGFSREERSSIERSVESHGGKIVEELPQLENSSSQKAANFLATISLKNFVLLAPREVRTVKFLFALVTGIPTVTPEWMFSSTSKLSLASISEFIISPKLAGHDTTSKAALQLFDGFSFSLIGGREFLWNFGCLIKWSGGELVTSRKGSTSRKVAVIVIEPGSKLSLTIKKHAAQNSIPILGQEWLVASIMRKMALPLEPYCYDENNPCRKAGELMKACESRRVSAEFVSVMEGGEFLGSSNLKCSGKEREIPEGGMEEGSEEERANRERETCFERRKRNANGGEEGPGMAANTDRRRQSLEGPDTEAAEMLGQPFSSAFLAAKNIPEVLEKGSHNKQREEVLISGRVKAKKSTRQYFSGARVEKDVFVVGDCVELLPEGENELPYVGKVLAIFQEGCDILNQTLRCQWFYRPEETPFSHLGMEGSELFLSNHIDEVPIGSVLRKILIQECSPKKAAMAAPEAGRDVRSGVGKDVRRPDFVCHFQFNVREESLTPLAPN